MKPVIFALVSMFCYALCNVILELKLSKYNNLTIMVCYGAIIFAMAFSFLQATKTSDPSFDFPKGGSLVATIVVGLLFFAADYFYIGAYTNGGNLATITIITVMCPVFASSIKYCLTKNLPNVWQVGGYSMAFIAIVLIVIGNKK